MQIEVKDSTILDPSIEPTAEKKNSLKNEIDPLLMDEMQQYINAASYYPLLTPEEERELCIKIKYGTEEESLSAKKSLVEHNLRYVVKIANRYVHATKHMSVMDLIQEGNMGLMTAAEKFDIDLGFRFTTYATHWIMQGIVRAVQKKDGLVYYPVHIIEDFFTIRKEQVKREKMGLPSITESEIMDKFHISQDSMTLIRAYSRNTVYIDRLIGSDADYHDTATFGDMMTDTKPLPDEVVIENDRKERIERALNKLTEKERDVIIRRFGLLDQEQETLERIGRSYQISKERVRQIETKALRKLRSSKDIRHML